MIKESETLELKRSTSELKEAIISMDIIGFLAKKKLDRPRFEESGGSFRIIFKRPEFGFEKVGERVGERVTEKVTNKVTENQKKIITLISQNRNITVVEIAQLTGISRKSVLENISKLEQNGMLMRIGPDKGRYWEIHGVNLEERVTERVTNKVTENQKKIMHFIHKNRNITVVEIAQLTNISRKSVLENISKLKEKGILKRIGPDKGGYWEIVEEN